MLKTTGIIRKMDELGRIVLPMDARKLLGFEDGCRLEILLDEEQGRLILQQAVAHCMKCGSTEALTMVKPGYHLCADCLAALR